MRQHYFENTIQSKFIQAFLHNTSLPICDTIAENDTIIEGMTYATRHSIVKCTQTGTYLHTGKVETVTEFNFSYFYPKFSEIYVPRNNYYDVNTHVWLGKWVRAYSNIYGIDLRPYYNVFSNEWLTDAHISVEDNEIKTFAKSGIKLTKIPIKFNKTYTIAIDCPATVLMCPSFFMKDYMLTLKNTVNDALTDITHEFIKARTEQGIIDIKEYPNLSYRNPITFRVGYTDFNFVKYERNLYLLLQLPYECNSSITVLEGDYTSYHNQEVTINAEELGKSISTQEINKTFVSELSLLQFNNEVSYPYADRLIEYMLNNVVDSEEIIGDNIKRVQSLLPYMQKTLYVKGDWNDYTRWKLYHHVMTSNRVRHIDINGFLDKDSEALL